MIKYILSYKNNIAICLKKHLQNLYLLDLPNNLVYI
jgi:hypothetical protein